MSQPLTHRVQFICVALFNGLSISLVMPLMGLFLIDEVGASPLQMGLFLAIQAMAGVFVGTRVARWSDKGLSRKKIIIVGQQFLTATLIVFALSDNYWVVLAAAVLLFSGNAPAMSQIYSLGREYCDQNGIKDTEVFISSMRAGFAVSFVIGPPVAFMVKAGYGFSMTFIIAIAMSQLLALITWRLPEQIHQTDNDTGNVAPLAWYRNASIVLLLGSFLFAFMANTLFVTAIPLYLTKELMVADQWAGYLLGLAALLEIPLMIFAGLWGARLGYRRVLLVGMTSGLLLFIGMVSFTQVPVLMGLQFFNALFVATTQTLGMLLMQKLMREQLGLANTLFSNVFICAMLLSNVFIGVIAQWFSYYHVFIAGGAMMGLAIAALWLMRVPDSDHVTA